MSMNLNKENMFLLIELCVQETDVRATSSAASTPLPDTVHIYQLINFGNGYPLLISRGRRPSGIFVGKTDFDL